MTKTNVNTSKGNLGTILFIALLLVAATPLPALANAGVPMIFLTFPAMLLALLPIILIESLIIQKSLNIAYKKAIIPNGVANAVSTIAGFPLAWRLLLGLELLTTGGSCGPGFETVSNSIITAILESAWLCPWENQLYWLIPVAFINCLIVAFFISIFIEYFIMKKMLKDHKKDVIKKVTYKANIISYALLVIVNIGYLVYSIVEKT
jgi:hypothetical protein